MCMRTIEKKRKREFAIKAQNSNTVVCTVNHEPKQAIAWHSTQYNWTRQAKQNVLGTSKKLCVQAHIERALEIKLAKGVKT